MPIPRRIIQTHRSESVGGALRQTWRQHHPDYEYLFFDDAQCRAFVAGHLPTVLPAYDLLPLPVQKADLFRYVAVFVLGGVYADVDTVCCAPLHSYVDMAPDQLVAGMEMEPADFRGGTRRYLDHYAAPFQLLQWTFCASPRHPALAVLIDRICFMAGRLGAEELAAFSAHSRFTLELTGPRQFTQVLLDFIAGTRQGAVTVLQRAAWGAWPAEQGRAELAPLVKVRHLFEGSWKTDDPDRDLAGVKTGVMPGAVNGRAGGVDETSMASRAGVPGVSYRIKL